MIRTTVIGLTMMPTALHRHVFDEALSNHRGAHGAAAQRHDTDDEDFDVHRDADDGVVYILHCRTDDEDLDTPSH